MSALSHIPECALSWEYSATDQTTPYPEPEGTRELSARELYAVSIWSWTRAHPASSCEDFLAMLERAEARARKAAGRG